MRADSNGSSNFPLLFIAAEKKKLQFFIPGLCLTPSYVNNDIETLFVTAQTRKLTIRLHPYLAWMDRSACTVGLLRPDSV